MNARERVKFLHDDRSVSSADSLIFEHLGIAVMLCWAELPFQVRDQILNQSNDVIGVVPIPGIRDRIMDLLLRHSRV